MYIYCSDIRYVYTCPVHQLTKNVVYTHNVYYSCSNVITNKPLHYLAHWYHLKWGRHCIKVILGTALYYLTSYSFHTILQYNLTLLSMKPFQSELFYCFWLYCKYYPNMIAPLPSHGGHITYTSTKQYVVDLLPTHIFQNGGLLT